MSNTSAGNIILIGMAGCGKSTLGRALSTELNRNLIDTDLLIEQEVGAPLEAILMRHGSRYLQNQELDAVLSLRSQGCIIATGGSVVYRQKSMAHLKSLGTVIYLHIGIREFLRRIAKNRRRGLVIRPSQNLNMLYFERLNLYRSWADLEIVNNLPLSAFQLARIAKLVTASIS